MPPERSLRVDAKHVRRPPTHAFSEAATIAHQRDGRHHFLGLAAGRLRSCHHNQHGGHRDRQSLARHRHPEGADAYQEHFTRAVLPALQPIRGYHGAYLLRRDHDGHVELQVLTVWDSLEAIRRFSGANLDRAVVEPDAQAVLASYDTTVTHHSVVVDTVSAGANAGTDQ